MIPYRNLILVGLCLAILAFTYVTGRKHEREANNAKQQRTAAAAAKETLRLMEKNYAISVAVTKVLERERIVTRTILERVEVEVPASACPVHPSFRVLHDAAARGENPAPAAGTDGAPVPVKDAAATVINNYGTCREDQARLLKLQEYVNQFAGREILCQPQQ